MATWVLKKKTLTVGAGERKNTLNLGRCQTAPDKGPEDMDRQIWNKEDKIHGDAARITRKTIQRMGAQEAKALGTDPADETSDSAAVKGAVCIALKEETIKMDSMGSSKNKKKGYGMCDSILTLDQPPTAKSL
ncbi:hypothetical protein Efla_002668 [Eimeria flavescens]